MHSFLARYRTVYFLAFFSLTRQEADEAAGKEVEEGFLHGIYVRLCAGAI